MNLKKHITEAKNTHMTHIEDMVIDGGVDGARSAIFALRDLRDMLVHQRYLLVSILAMVSFSLQRKEYSIRILRYIRALKM